LSNKFNDYRIERLKAVDRNMIRRLKKPVSGILRIFRANGRYQYFIRSGPGDRNGKYVKKAELWKAKQLAQHEFCEETHRLIVEELQLCEKLSEVRKEWPWEAAANTLSPGKRAIIEMPESDDEYVRWWLSQEFIKHDCDNSREGLFSAKREKLRSKSEALMVRILEERGIPFLYEKPLSLRPNHLFHPDFTLLRPLDRCEIIWEHFGMMDNEEYRNNAFRKIRIYEANGYFSGINMIITFETAEHQLDLDAVNAKLDLMFGAA